MNSTTNTIIYNKLQTILDSHSNINLLYFNDTIKKLDTINNSIDTVINILSQPEPVIKFKLNFSLHKDLTILNTVGYPWNIDINKALYSYKKGNIEDSDIIRYFDLLEKSLPELHNEINAVINNYVATEKWLYYLNKRIDIFSKIFNNYSSEYYIKDVKIEQGNAEIPYHTVKFYFNNALTYCRKKTVEKLFFDSIKADYEKILNIKINSRRALYEETLLNYYFVGRDSAKSNEFIIIFKTNDWLQLAMDSTAQFVPKLGTK